MFSQLVDHVKELTESSGGVWGVVIEDLQTGEEFRHNAEERFYAASIIKVPIMVAVFDAANEGKFHLSDTLALRREDMTSGAGVLQHMTAGTRLSIYDLVTLMIIQSDNTATNMLIDLVGKKRIREVIKELELSGTVFFNKLQVIPYPLKGSNQMTAGDAAQLMKRLVTQKVISWQACEQMIEIMKKQQLNDFLPSYYSDPDGEISGMPPSWAFAHKTGMVTQIHHDVGVLYRNGRAVLLSVFSRGLETKEARQTMANIGLAVYDYMGE
ncbi:serine hydrolase [Ammoniphilus sp. CFH 90114]|uniref:serine hydrolase n=1 Tax=Ammoniphilus sp. CFH 90114 TaxID=2493665 RepID=UPI00100DD72F|nr:serine hydrolase [Ammoniphilus sp. CFH 90114]RXT07866.1 serine hydrolase [Ammoniphilus sp. CFH 90114]